MPNEENVDNSGNLTSDMFKEESKSLDNSLNIHNHLEVHDNVENINVVSDSSQTTSIPTYLHNDSATENTESNLQLGDSSHEHVANIPSTSRFGEFLGNRNLLNTEKGLLNTSFFSST